MSKIRRTVRPTGDVDRVTPADALIASMGQQVLDVLDVAFRARLPLLIEGPTGIGKSQVVAEFAQRAQIGFAVLDLSLLEPPDLVGLPVIRDGKTHYAPPSELPQEGAGILMLEELNRAEIPVMQPALQLLSARRLHSYELPPGWSCVAAINPEDGDYQVHSLDPALRSRFLQLRVKAQTESWLPWARENNVHPAILRTVAAHADAFDSASPRSWTYASAALQAMSTAQLQQEGLLRLTLRGYLPTAWTLRVMEEMSGLPAAPSLDIARLFSRDGAAELARIVGPMTKDGRTDHLVMLTTEIRRAMSNQRFRAAVDSGDVTLESLEAMLAALPGDLRDQCLDQVASSEVAEAWLPELGTDRDSIAQRYLTSALQRQLIGWRDAMQLHRVRLVVTAAQRWLDDKRHDQRALHRAKTQLEALGADAGVLGRNLRLALQTRWPPEEVEQ